MKNQKVYHLSLIYKPSYVIKDVHGRHTNNREEVRFDVGVMTSFQDLVSVCSKINHTNAYHPKTLQSKFRFWGTSFDKRDPIPRDAEKIVSPDEALEIMMNGPKNSFREKEYYEDNDFDFEAAEKREMDIINREIMEYEYEEFVQEMEYSKKNYSDAVY